MWFKDLSSTESRGGSFAHLGLTLAVHPGTCTIAIARLHANAWRCCCGRHAPHVMTTVLLPYDASLSPYVYLRLS